MEAPEENTKFFYWVILTEVEIKTKDENLVRIQTQMLHRNTTSHINAAHLDYIQNSAAQRALTSLTPEQIKEASLNDVLITSIMPLGLMSEEEWLAKPE